MPDPVADRRAILVSGSTAAGRYTPALAGIAAAESHAAGRDFLSSGHRPR
jgi:hypothetical protein